MIDAHQHLWNYNPRDYAWMTDALAALRRNFLVPDLQEVTNECGVEATVAVQACQSTEETDWLLDLAAQNGFMRGVVGWVPLADPDAERHLERFAQNPKLKAVRHVLQDEPDDDYMLRADFNRGIGALRNFGLAYDILIYERHLPQTLTFVDRHPGQVFVLNHIAKPRIKAHSISPWRELMGELARRENVYCKVSGMATEADWSAWTAADLKPYFELVLAAFGPKRLMFGSDWPVVTLAGSYRTWARTFRSFIAELSKDEQEQICRSTAIAAYKL